MEKRAIMEVYLSESRRRRKERGMTMSLVGSVYGQAAGEWGFYMNAVIQNCLSTKKVMSSALGTKPTTTPGIKSPMMIR